MGTTMFIRNENGNDRDDGATMMWGTRIHRTYIRAYYVPLWFPQTAKLIILLKIRYCSVHFLEGMICRVESVVVFLRWSRNGDATGQELGKLKIENTGSRGSVSK
jgi:hypothetical protein